MLVVGLVVFSETVKTIGVIENVKRALEELAQSSNFVVQSNVTTVDVTGILPGKETQHEHIYKTLYDEDKHWEECMACGERQNENVHSYERKFANGEVAECHYGNYYTDTCSCGYSYIGHKPCVWDGKTYQIRADCTHALMCSVCNTEIQWYYYLNSFGVGEMYDYRSLLVDRNFRHESCIKNGNKITCSNIGNGVTCDICKNNITFPQHTIRTNELTNELYCIICNEVFGKSYWNVEKNSNTPITYTITTNIELNEGVTLSRLGGSAGYLQVDKQEFAEDSKGGIGSRNFTLISTAKFSSSYKTKYAAMRSYTYLRINGLEYWADITPNFTAYPDLKEPVIANIVTENESTLTTWSRTKPIVVTGTENYCNTVDVEIIDNEENVIFKGTTTVNNGNYSISCTPEIEAGLAGRKFKAIVTDVCDNKTEQEFEIARVDAIAPRITSGDEVGGDWAREKSFTFTANDYGVGNVEIGFNNVNDYSLAIQDRENFSKEYKLIGDVYAPREANVYYKDGLGNISTKKITINKLDNTAPTITNVNIHNNKLNVEVNDRHETWGEGSGVVKYRYMASDNKIEKPDVSTITNELNVGEDIVIENLPEVKYVYIVAEDLVGNVSKVYEVEIPQLVLTSEVKLDLANGKGGIKLDWSTYDIEDKYFVIYRKKENATDWQKIVSLEEKLAENTYIDEFANDTKNPNAPTIQIQGNIENNNINISTTSTDNGSKYIYYIESYDSNTNLLLNKSN